jgi:hypothetical protein
MISDVCEYPQFHNCKNSYGAYWEGCHLMNNSDQSVAPVRDGRTPTSNRLGRKPGKHSDERYTQTSIYLPIELRNRVRARLYEQGKEMSGLVEEMLSAWLAKQS